MPSPLKLGAFELSSPKIIVMDPGYSMDTARLPGGGRIVSRCRLGRWNVELMPELEPRQRKWLVPRTLITSEESCMLAQGRGRWHRIAKDIGSDGGVIGVYDLAHFQDGSVVPLGQKPLVDSWSEDPAMLWYSMNCDAVQGKLASVVAHGAVVHWDGCMSVDVRRVGGEIVGLKLSISGWPDSI